ncbi:universal stress protein [Acuticoccus sp. M5D2P5]|uniref:universal stress protein n=1 Tax=Acuticoccus kalidii TaxID=2910977 RepID=UPI001F2CF83B|nr:universal stress protein [Acuticoccus kalidii]MCF3934153.1 universal stress protein [Acuticoccus kalidii]
MGFRTVLVHADNSSEGQELLAQGVHFARHHDAHLVALLVGLQPVQPYASMVDVPFAGYIEDIEAARQEVQEATRALDAKLATEAISFEVRGVSLPVGVVGAEFARHARYADITILPKSNEAGTLTHILDATLFESGHPVLIAPKGAELSRSIDTVVIGWDASREATRAIGDAMPFLTKAKDVRIVMFDPRVTFDRHGEEPGADLATMLSRHGLKVSIETLARTDRSFSEAFLGRVNEVGGDLVVSGGYNHTRFGEMLFGGATRDLLASVDVPLLMSR